MAEENENEYIESIPESFRDVESIKSAGSLENLLNQHVNLEKKMGTAVFSPGEDADTDQWNKFYERVSTLAPGLTRIPDSDDAEGVSALYGKLGRPNEAAGYEVPEIKYGADGKVLDQGEYVEDFRQFAHENNITGSQFKKMLTWFGERTVNNLEAAAENRDKLMGELRTQWGDATDARISRVEQLVKDQGGEEAVAALGNLANNPVVLNMLDKMADAMMEENSLGNMGPAGDAATRQSIEDDIATLKNNEAFLDRKHADHERTVKRVDALYEKLGQYKAA
jgi:CRISPR/Cas system CSM-associated protein Csm2 small subunit